MGLSLALAAPMADAEPRCLPPCASCALPRGTRLPETLGAPGSSFKRPVCVSLSVVSDSLGPHGLQLSGSSVRGVLQARRLERAAIPFFRGSSQPREGTCVSCTAGRVFTV